MLDCPGQPGVHELVLRGAPGFVQSLHRFRGADGTVYDLPVLVRLPDDVAACPVVELTVAVRRADGAAAVAFPTVCARETGKQPNFLIGAMDVVANGLSVGGFLSPDGPHLVRLLLRGPLRAARTAFTAGVLSAIDAAHVLDVGGGRGGDCALWLRGSPPVGVRRVEVVEPDAAAVREYQRRLRTSFAARTGADDPDLWYTGAGVAFRFHPVGVFDRPPYDGSADVAVLHFSVSQIVANIVDAVRLFDQLRRVPHLVVVAHDHTLAPPPTADGDPGVRIDVVRGTGCARHPLVCACGQRGARLRTRIVGSATAADIEENAFSVDWFVRVAERCGRRLVRRDRPFPEDAHWLLRTFVAVWLATA